MERPETGEESAPPGDQMPVSPRDASPAPPPQGIDAQKGVKGNQKFKWIGKHGFHHEKGELHYKDLGSKCLVSGDVNGDGKADFEIMVKVGALNAHDFLL